MTFTPVKLGDRDKVIANIEANANRGHFNDKVEIHDPVLNLDQQHEVLKTYLALRQTHRYQWRGAEARSMMNVAAKMAAADMKVRGAENLTNISWPAIITCNHFSPIDSLLVRSALKQPDLAIVVELTNLKMSGMLGFLMTYADTIPISDSIEYMGHEFISLLKQALSHQQSILIYPERGRCGLIIANRDQLSVGHTTMQLNSTFPLCPALSQWLTLRRKMILTELILHFIYYRPSFPISSRARRGRLPTKCDVLTNSKK